MEKGVHFENMLIRPLRLGRFWAILDRPMMYLVVCLTKCSRETFCCNLFQVPCNFFIKFTRLYATPICVRITGPARKACAAESMERSSVRPSVRLSHRSTAAGRPAGLLLSAGAPAARRPQLATGISSPRGAQQQTRRSPCCCRSMGQTDGRTDA